MINFNLTGDALAHCLKISGAKLLLVDEEKKVRTRLDADWQTIERFGMRPIVLCGELKSSIAAKSAQRLDDSYREGVKASFPSALFYTR